MPGDSGSEGYRAAVQRVGLFPDVRRRVVAVSGAGALQVVNGLASNDVKDVPSGRGVYSFLLDRRGRVVVDLRILPVAGFERDAGDAGTEALWLDTPSDALPPLMNHLRKYVPPMLARHQVTDVAVHTLIGPRASEALGRWEAAAGAFLARRPDELAPLEATTVHVGGAAALAVRREEIEGAGFDVYVDQAGEAVDAERLSRQLEDAVTRVGGAAAVRGDWEILRLEQGLPVFGSELGAERLAQEAGQDDRAISFAKGCFTGQEVVARIHYRGHVNRHLRGLRWAPDALHQARDLVGATLRAPSGTDRARPVGLVTSAVRSPRFGPIGLGYVRREIAPGAVLESMDHPGVALHVTDVPFTHE
ncbi:YgfZ/GcvT domain-containing protein [Candidatus Palauibacter sp.]|uniref:CAF17-like 4Fe-4S cluster assembly/insertion protein YgfZ n=1 Tax=Candidatus Palauibacter sp. TaxID=3101350 RepID=UPI003D0F66DF